jgi:hypothetical protein
MAMLSDAGNRSEAAVGERALRSDRAYRAARASLATAKGTMLMALGTFPLVAAYHIDFGPEIAFEIDLGTVLWAALAPCALGCWLNGLRLLRSARRLSVGADDAGAQLDHAPQHQ